MLMHACILYRSSDESDKVCDIQGSSASAFYSAQVSEPCTISDYTVLPSQRVTALCPVSCGTCDGERSRV